MVKELLASFEREDVEHMHDPHPIFTEMEELHIRKGGKSGDGRDVEWHETAR